MTQASFSGLLYAAAGMFKTCLTYCHQDRKQSHTCIIHEAFSLRSSSDIKGLTLSLCPRLLGLHEIHSMAV